MIKGEPPMSDLHPMRVLFLIPKNDPPTLDVCGLGATHSFLLSRAISTQRHAKSLSPRVCKKMLPRYVFSYFFWLILNCKRPSASDLLKHRFIKNAKKPSSLVPLIERYRKWKQQQAQDESSESEDNDGHKNSNLPAFEFDSEDEPAAKPTSVPTHEKKPSTAENSGKKDTSRSDAEKKEYAYF
jgi:serine/threonine-protein kinase 24/25/MST4